VWEWNDTVLDPSSNPRRSLRGGSYVTAAGGLAFSARRFTSPVAESRDFGFRASKSDVAARQSRFPGCRGGAVAVAVVATA